MHDRTKRHPGLIESNVSWCFACSGRPTQRQFSIVKLGIQEKCEVAGDQDATRFEGCRCDDEIGIASGMAAFASVGPKIGRSIKYGVADWQYESIATKGVELVQLPPGLL